MTFVSDWSMYQSKFLNLPGVGLYNPANWVVDFDWQVLGNSDIAGVIIRVGTNKTKDPTFDRYLSGLKQINKLWGIYHAFWPAGEINQASLISGWCPEKPPLGLWGDLEAGNPSWLQTNAYLLELDKAYGVQADIYSGGPFLNSHYSASEQSTMSQRRLWIAGYPNYRPPLGWNKGANHTLHQFSSTYNCPGLPRPCDMSRTNPNVSWDALSTTPIPTPTPDLESKIAAHARDILRMVG